MKRMMLAAVAALAVCTVQAVTLSWKTGAEDSIYNGTTGGGAKQVSDVVDRDKSITSASYAIAVTFTQAIAAGDNHIVDLGQWNRGHTYINAYGGRQDLGMNHNTWWSQPPVAISSKEEGSRTFLFTVTYEKLNDTQTKMLCYIDGTKVMESTFDGLNGLNAQVYGADFYTVDSTAAYDGVLTAEEIAWMAENKTAVLPEPTTLALLALGVAGLALRRRAA